MFLYPLFTGLDLQAFVVPHFPHFPTKPDNGVMNKMQELVHFNSPTTDNPCLMEAALEPNIELQNAISHRQITAIKSLV